jgi:hypothetical protein
LKVNAPIFFFLGLLAVLAAGSPELAWAQDLRLRQQVALDRPGTPSLDRLNQFYLTDAKNNLHKFSEDGRMLQSFSPPQAGKASLVEGWNMLKIFMFYDGQGQAVLLDRFLNPISQVNLNRHTEGVVRLATLAADDRFWVFNESDFSLLKFDPRLNEAILQAPLNQILQSGQYDLRFMREYQNTVYLVDRNSGIYLFDNLGTYKKKLPVTGLSYLGFRGNEAYYLKDRMIYFLDLYSLQERTVPVPASKNYQHVLVGDKYWYLVWEKGVDIYSLP